MTSHTGLVESAVVSESRPLLGEVANTIADVQVRNRGTVRGKLDPLDPTNHPPPPTVAMGAQMTIAGEGGERTVPVEDFFLGVYMTATGGRAADEGERSGAGTARTDGLRFGH